MQTIVGDWAGSVQPDGPQLRLGWPGLGRMRSALVRRRDLTDAVLGPAG